MTPNSLPSLIRCPAVGADLRLVGVLVAPAADVVAPITHQRRKTNSKHGVSTPYGGDGRGFGSLSKGRKTYAHHTPRH